MTNTRDVTIYDADYFLRGRETGRSLYENYRWLPNLTIPMVERMKDFLGIRREDTVLDFGCARGYSVRAFRMIGIRAFGIDASPWAIENADPDVVPFVGCAGLVSGEFDWIVAKDVLEHVDPTDLDFVLDSFIRYAQFGIFIVVPLSPATDAPYVVPEYEQDVTHVVRWTFDDWKARLERAAAGQFRLDGCYLVPGIKDRYASFPQGNGFFTLTRI